MIESEAPWKGYNSGSPKPFHIKLTRICRQCSTFSIDGWFVSTIVVKGCSGGSCRRAVRSSHIRIKDHTSQTLQDSPSHIPTMTCISNHYVRIWGSLVCLMMRKGGVLGLLGGTFQKWVGRLNANRSVDQTFVQNSGRRIWRKCYHKKYTFWLLIILILLSPLLLSMEFALIWWTRSYELGASSHFYSFW